MNTKELREILEWKQTDYEHEVRVLAEGNGGVGPRSSVGVESVAAGFDWEQGRLLIKTDMPIEVQTDKSRIANKLLDKCIDSWYWCHKSDDFRNFGRVIRQHFEECFNELGIKERFEKQIQETKELQEKAKQARKKAKKENQDVN